MSISIYLSIYLSISIYLYTILYKYIYYHVSYSELSIYRYITKDRLLKFQLSAQLEVQYNNDGLRNDYGMRLNVSCIHNHQAYI